VDPQLLVNVGFGIAGTLGGFVIRALWDAMTMLQKDLQQMQNSLSETYVRRDDFRDHASRIEGALERIEAKLDHKADRP
jgi:peptidoglycan hydrolase CwlO-like protein